MRGLINPKPRFALKAQVFAENSASATTLACASLLANPCPPSLSHNLCSYYHPVTRSFDGYSSFLFSFGSGLGVRDPRPRIGIVICPLFPFWRAGRPVWKHSTGGSSIIFPWWSAAQAGPLIISAVSVPVMARGPSSEQALRRGPSYDLPLSHSWRAARAGPLSICLSCFIAPALAHGLSSELVLRRRPSSHFPLLDFGASRPVCKRAPRAGGRLVILARMVTHAVTSMPKTAKMRMRSTAS